MRYLRLFGLRSERVRRPFRRRRVRTGDMPVKPTKTPAHPRRLVRVLIDLDPGELECYPLTTPGIPPNTETSIMTTTDPSQPTTPPVVAPTDPTTPPAPPPAPPTPEEQLSALVAQAESDLASFQTAAQTAATSAAKAQADAATASAARATAHTDFVNIGVLLGQLDPGAPGVPQAVAALKKFAAIRHL